MAEQIISRSFQQETQSWDIDLSIAEEVARSGDRRQPHFQTLPLVRKRKTGSRGLVHCHYRERIVLDWAPLQAFTYSSPLKQLDRFKHTCVRSHSAIKLLSKFTTCLYERRVTWHRRLQETRIYPYRLDRKIVSQDMILQGRHWWHKLASLTEAGQTHTSGVQSCELHEGIR